jgi:hypothetical protein
LYEVISTFMITYRSVLRMRNVADRRCRDSQNKHVIFKNFVFEIRAVCEIKWKNIIELGRPQMKI